MEEGDGNHHGRDEAVARCLEREGITVERLGGAGGGAYSYSLQGRTDLERQCQRSARAEVPAPSPAS